MTWERLKKKIDKSVSRALQLQAHSKGLAAFARFDASTTAGDIQWAINVYYRLVNRWIHGRLDNTTMASDTIVAKAGFGGWSPDQYRSEFENTAPAIDLGWGDFGGFNHLLKVGVACQRTFSLASAQLEILGESTIKCSTQRRIDSLYERLDNPRIMPKVLEFS